MAYVKKVGARYEKARKQAAAESVQPPPAASQNAAGEKYRPLKMYYDEQGRVHIETR
jgi:hypothetical protein